VTFTVVTSVLAIEKYKPQPGDHIENMLQNARRIFRYMEPSLPISTQALRSLEAIKGQIAIDTGRNLDTAQQCLMSIEGQGIDSELAGFDDLGSFDWLANPCASLSRQTPGLDMSWLTGPGDWFS
jgi:hypothetical protein